MHHLIITGLIPAHAGKTSSMASKRPSTWDHTRSRGENVRDRPGFRRLAGSSPLTRGKPSLVEVPENSDGIIPAHAGKTDATQKFADTLKGSSPLTRGKHAYTKSAAAALGIIPAHAGKTIEQANVLTVRRDHPRSRGENLINSVSNDPPSGSSPLTRGKRAGW